MHQLVDSEAVGDAGQPLQHGQDLVGHAALVLEGLGADHRPLLGRRLVHAPEGGGGGTGYSGGGGGIGAHGSIVAPRGVGVVPERRPPWGAPRARSARPPRWEPASCPGWAPAPCPWWPRRRPAASPGPGAGIADEQGRQQASGGGGHAGDDHGGVKTGRELEGVEIGGPGDARHDGKDGHGDEATGPGHVVVHGRGHAGVVGRSRGQRRGGEGGHGESQSGPQDEDGREDLGEVVTGRSDEAEEHHAGPTSTGPTAICRRGRCARPGRRSGPRTSA